jgi:hypothetical protein
MGPVRAPLSQRSGNIRAKQAPRAPGQVRARELMCIPKFQPAGGAKPPPVPPAWAWDESRTY